MYRDGIGCEKDAEASERWYRQAFAGFLELEQQSHDDKLQYRIGWMLLHGVGTGKDEAAAREWFEQASKLDNPHAQYQLTRMIFNDPSSTPEQTAQALERLTKAAEAGQDCAQYALGKIYRDGQGVEKTFKRRWLCSHLRQRRKTASPPLLLASCILPVTQPCPETRGRTEMAHIRCGTWEPVCPVPPGKTTAEGRRRYPKGCNSRHPLAYCRSQTGERVCGIRPGSGLSHRRRCTQRQRKSTKSAEAVSRPG